MSLVSEMRTNKSCTKEIIKPLNEFISTELQCGSMKVGNRAVL